MILDDAKEPTMEDENAIFAQESGLRSRLLAEQNREDGPVVSEYFKEQRERYVPKKWANRPFDISMSHLVNYSHGLEKEKPQAAVDQGYVFVPISITDEKGTVLSQHMVIFRVNGGKIQPDAVYPAVDRGKSILKEFLEERGRLR
jgi:hypothetical protein